MSNIQSMKISKDAASVFQLLVHGTSNGVEIVTTKKGKKEIK